MRESLDQIFIARYRDELRKEMDAQGLDAALIEDAVAESVAHLHDAVEAANPQSTSELQAVLDQFGPAAKLAKRLAAEEARIGKRKRFLWPAILTPIVLWLSAHPVPQARLFHDRLYTGTLFFLLGGVVLLALGFRSRRPLLGQFGALTVILIVGQVGWYTATCYPVKYTSMRSMDWYDAVRRSDFSSELAKMHAGIVKLDTMDSRLIEGEALFADSTAPGNLPAVFTHNGQFWLPEGVREVTLDIPPSEISKGLRTSSWSAASKAWTERSIYWSSHAANNENGFRNEIVSGSEADRILNQLPDEIGYQQRAIASLQWYHDQPLVVRALAFVKKVVLYTVILCGIAAIATNMGWLLWIAWCGLNRVRRHLTYRRNPAGATS